MTGLDRWQELREAAAAATPGPWTGVCMGSEGYHVMETEASAPIGPRASKLRRRRIALCTWEDWETDKANAAYIAAASPDVVSALLGVVDRQARQLAAVKKCIADMRLAADLARSFVPAGEPSFVAEAIHEACNNVAAALAGGETNNDH